MAIDPLLSEKSEALGSKDQAPLPDNIHKPERGLDSQAENASDSDVASHEDKPKLYTSGKPELTEDACYDKLGFCFPAWKKWTILSVIFLVQMSMNFNTGVYSNAVPGLTKEFNISEQAARVGQCVFLVAYAFGCELWAPWSEEFGRWPIMQLSLFLVNIWQIPCALAPNFGTIVVCRVLGGLSSAGGSVTLGMTADMWESDDQGYAVAFVVLSSVGGSTVGPFFGGMIGQWLDWHWVFWIQLIVGAATQAIHFFVVPETRATILVDREAKRRRKEGADIWGPNELKTPRLDFHDVLRIWSRPFEMLLREPIVLFLSLLSGFSDALIFVFTESFSLVFEQWSFSILAIGLTFGSILIGYILAYLIFLPDIHRQIQTRRKSGVASRLAERRLLLLLFIAPLEPIGLLGFAWTSTGPPIPWVAPCIFACLIAMANYAIYMATIDYMVAAYGPYSASATGGNGFARDFLAGIATMYSTPMYQNMGSKYHLQWASTLLGCVGFLVLIPIYVFYWKGPDIRAKSKFAQQLAADRERNTESRRASQARASVGA
ncbi:Major facilitator superfamily domain general substrate transporter [Penicillium soppii]|jgi:MFS family permease|uniref:Major facilitator superfamily domain general substrate transporter n=1 Tax=Penicillium soppii TaxID=69789 RepID=UPI002546DCFC|nr:Major facilitator superfamily domain general substrate transporter [Penicillium soppii]KAJ5861201.1 Major facilitator superfamily domain general substrate transporter [Penicillium soppii]